jgi:Tfp pilus assembly PilM family ATPase
MRSSVDLIIRDLFSDLQASVGLLTDSQLALIKGLKKYYARNKKLSERQLSTLLEIKKYNSSPAWIK